jgi:hypothetical protein
MNSSSQSQLEGELQELRGEIEGLKRRIAHIEGLPNGEEERHFDVKAFFGLVQSITRDIFGERFSFSECEDFEVPGDRYIDVHVSDDGEPAEIVRRMNAWHREIVAVLPLNVRGVFRLSIE